MSEGGKSKATGSGDVPAFAVVGRVNKGKSSIVSTFTEDDSVRVDKIPGTTRVATRFMLRVRGRTLFTIVDTPGFEEPQAVLDWLEARAESASDRASVVSKFVSTFAGGDRFQEECELLEPILDGAGILYVVDASRPYRRNYEAEMEILRWTGRPRMALINRIGEGDHEDEWRRALDQYFSIVRSFDAHDSGFDERVGLLRAFRELGHDRADALDDAIRLLSDDWADRRRSAGRAIAGLIREALTMTIERPAGDDADRPDVRERWQAEFRDALRESERRERREVELLYRHETLEREENPLGEDVVGDDLFSGATWRVLGLDQWQLARAGAFGGAAVGGTLDLITGGSSFLAGTIIGAAVGGLSSYFGAGSAAQVEIVGRRIGGRIAVIGPIADPNLPWLLLDRALLHYRAVAGRAHAQRAPLDLGGGEERVGPSAAMSNETRDRLGKLFAKLRRGGSDAPHSLSESLTEEIAALLDSDTDR